MSGIPIIPADPKSREIDFYYEGSYVGKLKGWVQHTWIMEGVERINIENWGFFTVVVGATEIRA